MDFLEDIFDFGDRRRRNSGGIFLQGDRHDDHDHDDHDDHDRHNDHDDHDDHDHREHHGSHAGHNQRPVQQPHYPQNTIPAGGVAPQASVPTPSSPQSGKFCQRCSMEIYPGAKFCHKCGLNVEVGVVCASCGSKLPTGATFCPSCGYNGNPV